MHVGERSPRARAPACTIREACTEGNKHQTSARRCGCCFGPDLQQLLRASPPELEGEGEQRWELLLLLHLRSRPCSTAAPPPLPIEQLPLFSGGRKKSLPPSNVSPDEPCNTFNLFCLFLNWNHLFLLVLFFLLCFSTLLSLSEPFFQILSVKNKQKGSWLSSGWSRFSSWIAGAQENQPTHKQFLTTEV